MYIRYLRNVCLPRLSDTRLRAAEGLETRGVEYIE